MAEVRNISNDERWTPAGVAQPGDVFDVDDNLIWPVGLEADSDKGLAFMLANPAATDWRIPGVFEVVGDPPPVKTFTPDPEPETEPVDGDEQ